jgi:uncharacterized protein (TIRG00374 family)
LIVIVTAIGIIAFSIDSTTFDILERVRPAEMALLLAMVAFTWCLDAMKFIFLGRAAGERISFRQAISVVWINYFGSAITPMQSGGGPFQIYLLYKYRVAVGKSIAITLVRTLQVMFLLALTVPFGLLAVPSFMEKNIWIKGFAFYVLFFIAAGSILITISIVKPGWIKWVTSGTLVKMRRKKFVKPRLLIKTARRINKEIDSYNENIRLFLSSGKKWFFLSLLTAVLHLLIYLSIMPCLIMAVGYEVRYLECILAEALLLFLLYFVPTPGASGAAEGGAAAVLALFVPWSLAGVLAVSWRLLSEYSGTALGTIIAVKVVGWSGADKIMREEETEA